MSRRRYVYRVVATWPAGPVGGAVRVVRHYHSRQAAEHRAAIWRQGLPAREEYDHLNGHVEVAAEVRPAATVTVERSAPVDGWTPTGGAA